MNPPGKALYLGRVNALARAAVIAVAGFSLAGCKGKANTAADNRTFYQNDDQVAKGPGAERPYPPLDRKGPDEYVGVAVLDGSVRLSRPAGWTIRRVSTAADHRFIEYASPHEFLFAIYERKDDAGDDWSEILGRYEEDAKASGAELVGGRVPVATRNTQGREYVIKRTVKGQKAPYTNLSHEVVLRGDKHVDLVEIVHQGETLEPVTTELLRVMETLEVL